MAALERSPGGHKVPARAAHDPRRTRPWQPPARRRGLQSERQLPSPRPRRAPRCAVIIESCVDDRLGTCRSPTGTPRHEPDAGSQPGDSHAEQRDRDRAHHPPDREQPQGRGPRPAEGLLPEHQRLDLVRHRGAEGPPRTAAPQVSPTCSRGSDGSALPRNGHGLSPCMVLESLQRVSWRPGGLVWPRCHPSPQCYDSSWLADDAPRRSLPMGTARCSARSSAEVLQGRAGPFN